MYRKYCLYYDGSTVMESFSLSNHTQICFWRQSLHVLSKKGEKKHGLWVWFTEHLSNCIT